MYKFNEHYLYVYNLNTLYCQTKINFESLSDMLKTVNSVEFFILLLTTCLSNLINTFISSSSSSSSFNVDIIITKKKITK